jgi:hypothetical protein
MKNGHYEFRLGIDKKAPEIVYWTSPKTCYAVCLLREDSEDWHIVSVGDRMTEADHVDQLMHLAKHALRMLNNEKMFDKKKELAYD